jgi:hypothetical protein
MRQLKSWRVRSRPQQIPSSLRYVVPVLAVFGRGHPDFAEVTVKHWKRTANTQLRWIGGIVYTQESFSTVTQPSDSNAEGLIGVAYDSYRFKFGEIHMQEFVFPGLSDHGRIRSTTNDSLVIKLKNNFHFTFSFWDNYDSRPPTTAKKNELGLSSAVGWSF